MKKLKNILLIMVCLEHLCSGQTVFDNYYDLGYNNLQSCNAITRSDSGSVFVNYNEDSATGRIDMSLLSLDKNGNKLIHKVFTFNSGYYGFTQGKKHFIEATPSSYFVTGAFGVNGNQGFMLNKINRTTLDTIKSLAYGKSSAYYTLNNLVKIGEDKYYLIGAKTAGNSGFPVIFHIDSNLIIKQEIDVATTNSFVAYNALINPTNKKILIAGFTYPVGGNPNILLHVDTLGTITQSVQTLSSFTTVISNMYFSSYDSSYVAVGSRRTALYGNMYLRKLYISKYDKNLNMVWQKTYGDQMINTALSHAVILADGSIVASGAYSKSTTLPLMNENQNGVILKVSKDGYFRWMREFDHVGPGSQVEAFVGIDKTLEGGFVACGNVILKPNGPAWAVKTDSSGCIIPGCSSPTVQVDSIVVPPPITVSVNSLQVNELSFSIHPNPVSELLTITIKDPPDPDKMLLKIVDGLGREKLVMNVHESSFSLNLKGYEDGIYIVQVIREGIIQKSVKVLKN